MSLPDTDTLSWQKMSGSLPQAAGMLWVILQVEVRQRSEALALLI